MTVSDQVSVDPSRIKAQGVVYTPSRLAYFLAFWAVRNSHDVVLDPTCGDGALLAPCCERLRLLGGTDFRVLGVDRDAEAVRMARQRLGENGSIVHGDVFASLPKCDVLVTNPPYVRSNLAVVQLASSLLETPNLNLWCHVLMHSLASVKPGGRVAAVLPQSLVTGLRYKGIFDTLASAFEVVNVITLPSVFKAAQQNIALFLGDNKDTPSREVAVHALSHMDELFTHFPDFRNRAFSTTTLHEQSCQIYEAHRHHPAFTPLGDITALKNGYVTGANHFFHITEVSRKQLPDEVLTPALFRASGMSGLELTQARYEQAKRKGSGGYLLTVSAGEVVSVDTYIKQGQAQGLHQRYKCRKRTPWYAFPEVHPPQLICSYMSGSHVKVAANTAKVVVPNTFHGLNLLATTYTPNELALAFYNPLTMLSAEIEGHSLGGGVLKLEPSQLRRVVVPLPTDKLLQHHIDMDSLLSKGRIDDAVRLGGQVALHFLKEREREALFAAWQQLRSRRVTTNAAVR